MSTLFVAAVALIASTTLVAYISAAIQRQRFAYRGNTSGPGELVITGEGAPAAAVAPPPADEARSVAARGAQISAAVEKTDFASLGGTPPLVQFMTTYLFGDELYDESYSIDLPSGELLGELGVSMAETVELEGKKNVLAFEVWLFDLGDTTTSARVLVSEAAYQNESIRARLAPKGELVVVRPGEWTNLDSSTLRVRVRAVDAAYSSDPRLPDVLFDRLTVELAVWPNDGSPLPALSPEDVLAQEVGAAPEDESGAPRQHVRASYLVRFAERTYLRQPFMLRVTIPGGTDQVRGGRHRSRSARQKDDGGALSFDHRWYPDHPTTLSQPIPTVGVLLDYHPDEFHIPVPKATAPLTPGQPVEFAFPVKPLRAETLMLAVKVYYVGTRLIPERELEVAVTEDRHTGEVSAVTTRKMPARYADDAWLLATELLDVRVRSFLNATAPLLNTLTALAVVILILAFVVWVLGMGVASGPHDVLIVVLGALVALLLPVGIRPAADTHRRRG